MKKPTSIKAGFTLYLLAVLIGIPSLLINAVYAPEEQSKSAIIDTGLVFQGLVALLGYMIYLGRNWARNLNAVVFVLGTLTMLTSEQAGIHHEAVRWLGWVATVLYGAATILFFMPSSNLWFSKIKNEKKLNRQFRKRLC
ncbi:hypothetical protein [Noviherbaspirillum massiliense]|uniref:hypothetical protein n=1 Tax=Noviherbaspirillum massiliense TaxID=1465823 RepID=UPI0003629E63|nr:hypothetical protein [Noviherbaspirillum massiliense]